MGNAIPRESVGTLVGVIALSVICFLSSFTLVLMLWSRGQKSTYVTLLTIAVTCSTALEIVSEIHYGIDWKNIKILQYERAQASLKNPALGLGMAAGTLDLILYFTRHSLDNTESLLILSWNVALFQSTWALSAPWAVGWENGLKLFSKIFALFAPAILIGVANSDLVIPHTCLYIILIDGLMAFALTLGCILLVLLIVKYVLTRKEAAVHTPISSRDDTIDGAEVAESPQEQSIYDRGLIIRFTVAFLAIAAFEIRIITYQLSSIKLATTSALKPGPDFSQQTVTADLVQFIPQVCASLAVFLIFGTTRSWREYRDLVLCRRAKVKAGLEEADRLRRMEDEENNRHSYGLDNRVLRRDLGLGDDVDLENYRRTGKSLAMDSVSIVGGFGYTGMQADGLKIAPSSKLPRGKASVQEPDDSELYEDKNGRIRQRPRQKALGEDTAKLPPNPQHTDQSAEDIVHIDRGVAASNYTVLSMNPPNYANYANSSHPISLAVRMGNPSENGRGSPHAITNGSSLGSGSHQRDPSDTSQTSLKSATSVGSSGTGVVRNFSRLGTAR